MLPEGKPRRPPGRLRWIVGTILLAVVALLLWRLLGPRA